MTPSENSMSSTLPLMMGKKLRSPCTRVESELARATSCPVGIRSRLSKSMDLQMVVHGVAQVVLDGEGHPAAPVAADVGEAERGQPPGPTSSTSHGHSAEVCVDDDAVDDLALDQRHDRLADAAETPPPSGPAHVPAVPQHVAPQAAHPARRRRLQRRGVEGGGINGPALRRRAAPGSRRWRRRARPATRQVRSASGVRAHEVVEAADHLRLDPSSSATPSGVRCRARPPLVAGRRPTRPAAPAGTRASTAALTVGLPMASRSAMREARSSPEATAERTR